MEVRGLCSICGLPAKLYTCPLCGKTVCSQCIDPKKHICIKCVDDRTDITHGYEDVRAFK